MSTETELKLGLAPDAVAALLRHPLLANPPRQQQLTNTYFDTQDLALTQQKVAVRERQVDGLTLLTVKTADKSVDGLSQRQEWEAPTVPGAFDFAGLMGDSPLARALDDLAPRLIPVFTTDFERLSWRIPVQEGGTSSLVEVALDQGTIAVTRHGQTAQTPICELELELKAGEASALNHLASQLQEYALLTPKDDSKAARGYALFHTLANA